MLAWRALVLSAVLALLGATQGAFAQNTSLLVVDQEQLFLRSTFGQRMREDISRRSTELATENRRIEVDLVAEEKELTEKRQEMDVEAFRVLAEAFDEKVVELRQAQDAKTRAINRANEEAQQVFFSRVARILGQIMSEQGALAILDARVVLLSSSAIDITDIAIERIDAELASSEFIDSQDPAVIPSDNAPPTVVDPAQQP